MVNNKFKGGSSNILSRQMSGNSGNSVKSTNILQRQPQGSKAVSKIDKVEAVADKRKGKMTGNMQ